MPVITMPVTCITFFGVIVAAFIINSRRRPSCVKLPRLPQPSLIAGNLGVFLRVENVGDADREFVDRYGLAFWMKGILNTDILYLADPKGIQAVLNTPGYTFRKATFFLRLITGPSLIAVEGETHTRQRRIMNPGFSRGALKEFVPFFIKVAQKAAGKWKDIVADDNLSSPVIDIYALLSRMTLDAVGQAAFSYDFGAVDNTDNEFSKAFQNVFGRAFHKPSDGQLVIAGLFGFLPTWTIPYLRLLPVQGMKRLSKFTNAANNVVHDIVQKEMRASHTGLPGGKDIMSILIRANFSECAKSRMSEEEMFSQMTGIIVAGQDTTTATLVWMFYELSRHPEVQDKLRDEIRVVRASAASAGRDELGIADFETMEYTIAVIKETLRFYPIASHILREVGRKEIIPISRWVRTSSGEEVAAIPVQKGQRVLMSVWSYNRIKGLWGEDADEWNPERFLSRKVTDDPKINLGVYANLATFSSGEHSCIGWRFAVLEMQATLITLAEEFKFSPLPVESETKIIPASAPTLIPIVKGQEERGPQMPLCISTVN